MRQSTRLAGPLLLALVTGTVSLYPGGAHVEAAPVLPRVHIASSCRLAGQEQKLGPTYVTAVSVSGGGSCQQAFTLVRLYYHCRLKHGGKTGYCSGVEGFRCSEHRFLVIKVQFNARVACTRGRELVRHDFTQFT